MANRNKLVESEEILPEEPTTIDEEAMIKLTNKIKNAIIHYIMISWDEVHKFDQPPIIIKRIEDEIEITDEKVEKNFDEIAIQYLDATKIMNLGWKPEIQLEEGLAKTIEWYRHYHANRGW